MLNFLIYLDNFADYKKLRGGVYFVDALPLTPSGKVIRRLVKEIAIKLYNKTLDPKSNENHIHSSMNTKLETHLFE